MLTCAAPGLCIVAVHAIEIVNSDVNIYQLLVSGFVLSCFSFQIFNMIIQICIMYDNLNVVQ
jgi:hypothetical protein